MKEVSIPVFLDRHATRGIAVGMHNDSFFKLQITTDVRYISRQLLTQITTSELQIPSAITNHENFTNHDRTKSIFVDM